MYRRRFIKGILTWLCVGALLLLFLPICTKSGKVDYFLLWVLMGFPYGMRRKCLILIQPDLVIGGSTGVIVLNCLISGLIGGIVLAYRLVDATVILIATILSGVRKVCWIISFEQESLQEW